MHSLLVPAHRDVPACGSYRNGHRHARRADEVLRTATFPRWASRLDLSQPTLLRVHPGKYYALHAGSLLHLAADRMAWVHHDSLTGLGGVRNRESMYVDVPPKGGLDAMTKEIKLLAAIAVVVIIGAIIGTSYYRSSIQSERVTSKTNTNKTTAAPAGELIRPDSYTLGSADAPVTLVEFYDPECESCAAFSPIVKKIMNDYSGKVRLVARYMPLHPSSLRAAAITEAAGEQGKYWQMQELLFRRQSEWGQKHGPPNATSQNEPSIETLFEKYAMELGLDLEKVKSAIEQNRFTSKITRDQKDGQNLGVRSTPTFFVNGRQLARLGEQELRSLIDEELKK